MIRFLNNILFSLKTGIGRASILMLIASIGTPCSSEANRLDLKNHNLLIEKLESSRAGLGPRSREYQNVTLRLADLLADRARLHFLEGDHDAVQRDRSSAVKLYDRLVSLLKGKELIRVLIQKAHLEEVLGSPLYANNSLSRAIQLAPSIDRDMLQKALAQRGELNFKQRKFAQAKIDFEKAINLISSAPLIGYWTYRLAWSELNLGNHKRALGLMKKLLSQPDLLVKVSPSGEAQFDEALHADALGDLVIFMARDEVNSQAISELLEMTPQDKRFSQLKNLALELERLGRKAEAVLAWDTLIHEGDGTSLELLENRLHTTQLKWDLNQKSSALKDFQETTELWAKAKCAHNPNCEEYRKLLKNFVIVWHKTELKKPSSSLISAYQALLKILPDDAEMHFQAGEASAAAGKQPEATQFYIKTAELTGNTHKLSEVALVKALTQAEKTKNNDLRMKVYNFYLKQHPQGQIHIQVRYQRAHQLYSIKKHDQALAQFKELIDWPQKVEKRDQTYQILAADLALDVLATQKVDREIHKYATAWAKQFPTRQNEYLKIARQAILRISSEALKASKHNHSDLKEAYDLIQSTSLAATDKESRDLVMNQILLAERLKDSDKILGAAKRFLGFKNLNSSDTESAKSYLVWGHELRLDFTAAYQVARTMKWPKLTDAERELKLALLAELSNGNATLHYKRALKLTRSPKQQNRIRASMVRLASKPWSELRAQKKYLLSDPSLSADLIVYAFDKTGNLAEAQHFASLKELSKSGSLALFHDQTWLSDWKILKSRLGKHKLAHHTDRLLKVSLEKRMSLIQDMEKQGQMAQKRGHYVGQLLVAKVLSNENERLYRELLKLPVPAKLKKQEAKKYQDLLKGQALPYHEASQTLDKQANQLLAKKDVLDALEATYVRASQPIQNLIRNEWQEVAALADTSTSRAIQRILNKKSSTPSLSDLTKVQNKLKSRPFDISLADEALKVAEKRGHLTLATYLDERKNQIRERRLE